MCPKCFYKTVSPQVTSKRELVEKIMGHLYRMQLYQKSQKVSLSLYGETIAIGRRIKGCKRKEVVIPHSTSAAGLSL